MGIATGITMRFFYNGAPLVDGRVYFYEPGTATLKNVYTDSTYGTPAANPATTNNNGEVVVWGKGDYKIAAYTAELPGGTLVDEEDGVSLSDPDESEVEVTPLDFGATGDGSATDSTAIASMFTDCATTGNTAYFPPNYTWKIDTGLTADGSFDVRMESPIIYHGTASDTITALKVGGSTMNGFRSHKLWVRANTESDWTNADNIGIEICNIQYTDVEIVRADDFTTNVLLHADATAGSGYLAWN
ncbi:MAG: hypothetical protein HKN64_05170, partial [Woeseiaceae bacterium]|nr:hypothetical protein [Woeseiaceae bacterium]